jgi:hypothetical protein
MSEEIQQVDSPETPAPEAPSQSFDNSAPQHTPAPAGSVYDAFKALPEFQGADDVAIAQTLYQSMQGYQQAQQQLRQYQDVMPATMEYMQNRQRYQEWVNAQQAQQQKPAEPPKWWNPPQVKDTWKNYIVRDPQTGREVIDPNAPMDAKLALQEYQTYTADFAKRFVTNPEDTLKPFIEQVAMQKAQELVQQHLGQYTAQNYVSSLEQQNADWLYDQRGQISPEGRAIQGYIEQAAQSGISSPDARWQYATSMLERDLLNLRYQQLMAAGQMPPQAPPPAPEPEPVAQSNMQFLRERATRTPSRSGGATEPRAPRPKMTLEERLKSQLVKDGLI